MAMDEHEELDELGGAARELLTAARAASTPTPADRARVWSALEAQLGAPVGGPESVAADAPGDAASVPAG